MKKLKSLKNISIKKFHLNGIIEVKHSVICSNFCFGRTYREMPDYISDQRVKTMMEFRLDDLFRR